VNSMPRNRVDALTSGTDLLGEAPVWDDRDDLLYRVDLIAGVVTSLDTSTGTERRHDMGLLHG
jgi:sugar lactone lactonase YvrE